MTETVVSLMSFQYSKFLSIMSSPFLSSNMLITALFLKKVQLMLSVKQTTVLSASKT
jgi:hypothetical protein